MAGIGLDLDNIRVNEIEALEASDGIEFFGMNVRNIGGFSQILVPSDKVIINGIEFKDNSILNATLDSPNITNYSVGSQTSTYEITFAIEDQDVGPATLTFPDMEGSDGAIIIDTKEQTLFNKKLDNPDIIGNTTFENSTNNLVLTVTDQTVSQPTITIPDLAGLSGDIVTSNFAQTLTNKTITGPTLSGSDIVGVNGTFTSVTANVGTVETINAGDLTASDVNVTGYIEFEDITAPANGLDNTGRLYKKSGSNGIFWLPDSAGTEINLTDGENLLPLTTKGDLFVHNGSGIVRLPTLQGSDGYVLSLDSSDSNGVAWVDSSETFVTKLWFLQIRTI